MKTSFKRTIEIDVEVVGQYTGATPSRLSGPPEDCYQGDPEDFEIEAVLLDPSSRTKLDVLPWLSQDAIDDLRQEGCEHARERLEAEYEDQMVASAEARRDSAEDR